MLELMTHDELDEAVERKLRSAEHLATAAVRTIRISMPHIPRGRIVTVLDDVDRLFSRIEATEHFIRLARTAENGARASGYAEEAYSLARLALDDAAERVRAASEPEALRSGSEQGTARECPRGPRWSHEH